MSIFTYACVTYIFICIPVCMNVEGLVCNAVLLTASFCT